MDEPEFKTGQSSICQNRSSSKFIIFGFNPTLARTSMNQSYFLKACLLTSWDRVTAQMLTVKLVLAGKKSNRDDMIGALDDPSSVVEVVEPSNFFEADGSSVFNSGPNLSMAGDDSDPKEDPM